MRELAGALKGLTDLRLAYNRVEAEGGTAIAKMLRDEGHAGLSRLDMGGCRVGPEAGLEIAKVWLPLSLFLSLSLVLFASCVCLGFAC
eukprot:3936453-Rhodomonas_salina.1